MHEDKHSLRDKLRQQRRALPEEERILASQGLLNIAKQCHLFQAHQRIACYVAHDGEIDPQLILHYAWQLGKNCYLPVLPKNSELMHFIQVEQQHALVKNHYGISEPSFDLKLEIAPAELDLVLVPLVAFDKVGHRLGRGKGYYDKCFSFLKNPSITKPILIGVAYQFQYLDVLPSMSHDIPLNGVLTEKQFYDCD